MLVREQCCTHYKGTYGSRSILIGVAVLLFVPEVRRNPEALIPDDHTIRPNPKYQDSKKNPWLWCSKPNPLPIKCFGRIRSTALWFSTISVGFPFC